MAALKGLTEVRNRSHAQKGKMLLHHGRQPQKIWTRPADHHTGPQLLTWLHSKA